MVTRLEIVSDVVCPWCYIGMANLERAISGAGNPFEIRWRPFQLAPDLPPGGMARSEYVDAKFGGPEAARKVYERVEAAAREAGLELRMDRITRAPNSLDAHRTLRWAEAEGVQHALAGILFRRYFVDGEDVGDAGVLEAAAVEAGMDGAVVARLLAGDADREDVAAEARAAAAAGVTGVPTFILGGRYALSGAQPPEVWATLIEEIEAARAAGAAEGQGPA